MGPGNEYRAISVCTGSGIHVVPLFCLGETTTRSLSAGLYVDFNLNYDFSEVQLTF